MGIEFNRIYIKGGVLSPGELKQIIHLTESLGLSTIKFGSRQDILFPYKPSNKEIIDQYPSLNIESTSKHRYQNIVCSYVAADISPTTSWLKGSTYLYILEQFRYCPKLKINITDPKQQLTPLYSGELNFIASENEDYWHLNLNLPNWNNVDYPVLIYSWDMPKIAKALEELHTQTTDLSLLFQMVNEKTEAKNRTIESELKTPFQPFPYYEGMNKTGENEYWLGLYWRNNEYDLKFLNDFCNFCLESRVGKICITSWKSFIVKGIHKKYRFDLERFLGKRGINIRHSSLELNWHLPVDDKSALELKEFIVRNFDQNDISTYGLNFSISDRSRNDVYFTSTVIEKNEVPKIVKGYHVRPTYNVLYCKNFNPNTREYLVYAQDVDKIELPGLLMELSKLYFEKLGESEEVINMDTLQEEKPKKEVYQCSECLTIYDSGFGDKKFNVKSGTLFENIPSDYICPVCEAVKSTYVAVEI